MPLDTIEDELTPAQALRHREWELVEAARDASRRGDAEEESRTAYDLGLCLHARAALPRCRDRKTVQDVAARLLKNGPGSPRKPRDRKTEAVAQRVCERICL